MVKSLGALNNVLGIALSSTMGLRLQIQVRMVRDEVRLLGIALSSTVELRLLDSAFAYARVGEALGIELSSRDCDVRSARVRTAQVRALGITLSSTWDCDGRDLRLELSQDDALELP